MKSIWSFFLLAPFFGMNYCSIKSNVVNQPPSLLKSALTSLAKWQMKHFLIKEPFVAYNKLENGTLELFGTAFGDEVTDDKIMFLQENILIFNIHSVVFRWFYFDEKMVKIFDIFDEKLQKSVKSFTIEKCYFPEGLRFKSSLELKYVTKCCFIDCFSNEESFKAIFKIFKKESVTSLTISRVFDYKQDESVNTNVALKRIAIWNFTERITRVNDLKLNEFFPNINFLSLLFSSLDFAHFSLTLLKSLNYADLSYTGSVNLYAEKLFKCLPTDVKCIKVSETDDYYGRSFIENAFKQKVIIDSENPFYYDKINCASSLSVFSSLYFDMNKMNDEMPAIKSYVECNGSVIKSVTSVEFSMTFNYESIVNMITLLTYFPNIVNLEVIFFYTCNTSINDDDIRPLFATLSIRHVKKLRIYFHQRKETFAFYCFIVELMKRCQEISSLKFYYSRSNSFAFHIKEMIKKDDIQFINLDTFSVIYSSESIDVSIDLFYVEKYKIKNLSLSISGSAQILDELNQYECVSVDNLAIDLLSTSTVESVINKIFTKFPNVTNLSWCSNYFDLISTGVLQNMKSLKNVTVYNTLTRDNFVKLTLVYHDLESLQIKCRSNEMEEIEKIFYERFPTATLTLNVYEM